MYSSDMRDSLLTQDNHGPAIARVNVVFSNFNEFSQAFNCPVGSKMNPLKKCVVW